MKTWTLLASFTLLLIELLPMHAYIMMSTKLTCFSEPKGDKSKDCDKTRGFRTCFTRYDHNDQVTGRGCSTKKSSYQECETHSYGEVTEKFCYCTQHLCNSSPRAGQAHWPILCLSLLLLLAASTSTTHHISHASYFQSSAPFRTYPPLVMSKR